MVLLSKRSADASKLLSSLEKDPVFQQKFLAQGYFNNEQLEEASHYVSEAYSCGKPAAEEVILQLVRGLQQRHSSLLTNRRAQAVIEIPPTADHPVGRRIPVEKIAPVPPVNQQVQIESIPATTPQQKVDEMEKAVVDTGDNRQQRLINSLKALKIALQEVAKDMYQVELLEENLGKAISKNIEVLSDLCAGQTADSVKSLASPLIGES